MAAEEQPLREGGGIVAKSAGDPGAED
jgi:hypothetical protein